MVKRGSITALLGVLATGACNDNIEQPKIVQLKHDETGPVGDGGHVVPEPMCSNESCCPKAAEAPECYPGGKNPSDYSGAECLAQRDNTGAQHRQLRQTQSISVSPPGNADQTVAGILLARSGLHSACTPGGVGGFIQLMDFDNLGNDKPEDDVAMTGFAAFVQEQSDALAQGLCFVEDTYNDTAWTLPEVYAPTDWPKGLPPPQVMPWSVKPVRAARYVKDFDLKTERDTILARLAPDGDLTLAGFTGVFYSDETRGYSHGYAPLGYIVTQDSISITPTKPTTYNAIPIREAEITTLLNDPQHPNCVGVFGNQELPTNCATSTATPAWYCGPKGNCGEGATGPTKVEGYFLTVEAEQVHVGLLKQTLCYSLPGKDGYPGWPIAADGAGELACRNNSNWDPRDPVKRIPPGDWCARTNSEANGDCHDAWKSVSYSTFQAFPIQVGKTCPAL